MAFPEKENLQNYLCFALKDIKYAAIFQYIQEAFCLIKVARTMPFGSLTSFIYLFVNAFEYAFVYAS